MGLRPAGRAPHDRALDRRPAGPPAGRALQRDHRRLTGAPHRAVLVIAPLAGAAHRLPRARRALRDCGVEIVAEVAVQHAERVGDWVRRAGEAPILVVAAGGDGTVGSVAHAVAGSEAVLAVLPLGTANDFARSLGIPIDPVKAARLITDGKVSWVDAGRCAFPAMRPRHFVHAATVGLNVSFARLATDASLRRRFGRLAYAVAAARVLRHYEAFAAELHHDGNVRRLELVHLAVMNAPVFGGPLVRRVGGARLADRALDVIAVERMSPARLVLAALLPILGLRRRARGVHALRVSTLRVDTSTPRDLALDGEIRGRLPAGFDVAGRALRVVTPADFDEGSPPEQPSGGGSPA